jgi:hypothetical protein
LFFRQKLAKHKKFGQISKHFKIYFCFSNFLLKMSNLLFWGPEL